MKRLCVTVGLLCAVACTAARAEDASVSQPKPTRPHPTKAVALGAGAAKSASTNVIRFSDPYAPPVGVGKLTVAQFPAPRTVPADPPQGGWIIGVGRDTPDSPFTGGFKLRF
jgi:hypothetical protein